MDFPVGTKRYGMGLIGQGVVAGLAPFSASDDAVTLLIKMLPTLLPILMDGLQKIAEELKKKPPCATIVEQAKDRATL